MTPLRQKSQSDQDISKDVKSTLGSGWFSKGYESVTYQVNDGVVTLKGNVQSIQDKNKVEDSLNKIKGVKTS